MKTFVNNRVAWLAAIPAAYLIYKVLCLRALFLVAAANCGSSGIPFLINALDDRSEPVRAVTVNALAKKGEQVIPALIQALSQNQASTREGAAISLGRMAKQSPEALPELKTIAASRLRVALKDADPRVCAESGLALWRIEQQSGDVIPTLLQILQDGRPDVRYVAESTLEEMGSQGRTKEIRRALILALEKDQSDAAMIRELLGEYRPNNDK